jgi:hypothetical protein
MIPPRFRAMISVAITGYVITPPKTKAKTTFPDYPSFYLVSLQISSQTLKRSHPDGKPTA